MNVTTPTEYRKLINKITNHWHWLYSWDIGRNPSVTAFLEKRNDHHEIAIEIGERWDISKEGVGRMSSYIKVDEMDRRIIDSCYRDYKEALVHRDRDRVLQQIRTRPVCM